jgi:DNA-binding response OmpR family regulator
LKRILLIEDDPALADMLNRRLVLHGYLVDAAPSAEAALERARASVPDVILVDYALPGMNGWDLVTLLRKEPRFASLPIYAVSAHSLPSDRARARAAGCTDFFGKPIDMEALLMALRIACGPVIAD